MNVISFCIGILLCAFTDAKCIAQEGIECVLEKSKGEFHTVSVKECPNYSNKCCVSRGENGRKCYAKMADDFLENSKKPTPGLGRAILREALKISKKARLLNIGSGGCIPPLEFPSTCNPTIHEPYVVEPPLNIPYCLRIPCSIESNEPLEKNQRLCGTQAGCYFDKELFEYRRAFGSSVLPGVPVCHLAVRSSVFHEKAQKVADQYGEWNPYFTNCLLREFHDEIMAGPKGCELIQILEALHIKPKLAGWGTTTTRTCAFIGGCWRPGSGCFYAVDVSNIIIKSGQRSSLFSKSEIVYGRPKCQHFDNSSPLSILKSYHQCLSSGCTVDVSVRDFYHSHLFSIGEAFNVKKHWEFWDEVGSGRIGAHNIEDRIYDLGYDPNNLPSAPVRSTSHSLVAGESRACGFNYKKLNARPCPPSKVSPPQLNPYCPYKPFHVQNFGHLKGSFEGCCDINLCYLPKSEISGMHSGSSHYYSEWSSFSSCSVSCGVGTEQRSRKCIGHDKSRCPEPLVQIRSCKHRECASWTEWENYTSCPKTCFPGGVQARRRKCKPQGGFCPGESEQERSCNEHPCFPDDSPKGVWTPWQNHPCTFNRSERMCEESKTRYCSYMGIPGGKCPGSSLERKRYKCSGCIKN